MVGSPESEISPRAEWETVVEDNMTIFDEAAAASLDQLIGSPCLGQLLVGNLLYGVGKYDQHWNGHSA
jgi:hypothetical protein